MKISRLQVGSLYSYLVESKYINGGSIDQFIGKNLNILLKALGLKPLIVLITINMNCGSEGKFKKK